MSSEEGLGPLPSSGAVSEQQGNLSQPIGPSQSSPSPGSYRQRTSTQWRGVTATTGANSGSQKYDVQFVFCDNGTKKHPKIYGFSTLDAAARAFDLLTLKRALEKGRTPPAALSEDSAPGTNHPLSEYQDEELLCLLGAASRDDVIYGLKHCAKHGHTLARGVLLQELRAGMEAAQAQAEEKRRIGDPRQSYEAAALRGGAARRRSAAAAAGSPTPAAPGAALLLAAQGRADEMAAAGGAGGEAAAVTLRAEDIVGHGTHSVWPSSPSPPPAAAHAQPAGGPGAQPMEVDEGGAAQRIEGQGRHSLAGGGAPGGMAAGPPPPAAQAQGHAVGGQALANRVKSEAGGPEGQPTAGGEAGSGAAAAAPAAGSTAAAAFGQAAQASAPAGHASGGQAAGTANAVAALLAAVLQQQQQPPQQPAVQQPQQQQQPNLLVQLLAAGLGSAAAPAPPPPRRPPPASWLPRAFPSCWSC